MAQLVPYCQLSRGLAPETDGHLGPNDRIPVQYIDATRKSIIIDVILPYDTHRDAIMNLA